MSNIQALIDDSRCFQSIQSTRWPDGVRCPECGSAKGAPGRGTLAKEKPPIFGMIQRGGLIATRMLADVKQKTIGPLIKRTIAPGAVVYTAEYDIYARLPQWGYAHQTVCHAAGEFARDDDGDGSCEVHVNTLEGFWSLLRSWLRPHRGILQERLPLYLGSSSSCTTYAGGARHCWGR